MQLMGESGVRLVVSSAAESVITLKIEPGSKGTCTPRSSARQGIVARLGRFRGIVGRIVGQRVDLAGVRIHRDHRAAAAFVLLHGGLDLALGDELDSRIDGERERLPGLRGLVGLRVQNPLLDVDDDVLRAGLASQQFVEAFLDAGEAFLVLIHAADQVRRDAVVRVFAHALRLELDPVALEIVQAPRLLRRDLASSPTGSRDGPPPHPAYPFPASAGSDSGWEPSLPRLPRYPAGAGD